MKVALYKVTIVAEPLLKEGLIEIIYEFGATGYTLIKCEGEGSRGDKTSDWEGRNVQIETIVSEETADAILDRVGETYMEDYSLIAYLSEVHVKRKSKFAKEILSN